MPKKPGAYHRPKNLSEALQLLDQPGSVALAGGTKLLASEAGIPADHVIDLQSLGLNQIEAGEGLLTVGATCTLSDFAAVLARENPSEPASVLLQEAIHHEGPNTYRNAATVGGSIASRLPDSELLAALLALEARLSFASSSNSGETSLAAYLNTGDPSALITSVQIPWIDGRGAVARVARTPADYPIVSIAAWHPSSGSVRLAATGLGPYPERLYAAENVLSGELDQDAVDAAAAVVKENIHHPGDFRGDTAYRAQMGEVLARRVLLELSQ
jgi:probable selenate reductase FAD-binding subunit